MIYLLTGISGFTRNFGTLFMSYSWQTWRHSILMLVWKKTQTKYCADGVQIEFKKSHCFLKIKIKWESCRNYPTLPYMLQSMQPGNSKMTMRSSKSTASFCLLAIGLLNTNSSYSRHVLNRLISLNHLISVNNKFHLTICSLRWSEKGL